jgi:hypothetical protein
MRVIRNICRIFIVKPVVKAVSKTWVKVILKYVKGKGMREGTPKGGGRLPSCSPLQTTQN